MSDSLQLLGLSTERTAMEMDRDMNNKDSYWLVVSTHLKNIRQLG